MSKIKTITVPREKAEEHRRVLRKAGWVSSVMLSACGVEGKHQKKARGFFSKDDVQIVALGSPAAQRKYYYRVGAVIPALLESGVFSYDECGVLRGLLVERGFEEFLAASAGLPK